MSNFCLKQFRVWKLQRSITTQSYLESHPPPPPRIYTLQTNLCSIKCQLRHGSRKGGAVTSFPGKILDFNSLESPFPGLWVIQTEYWPVPGFYLGFIIWGRSSKWREFPRGGGMPPWQIFLKWICAELQFGAFRDTILRNITVVFCFIFSLVIKFCYNTPCSFSYSVLGQGILTPCALTLLHLDDFSDIVTYIMQW